MENGHRNSGFSHSKWWIFPVRYVKLPEGLTPFCGASAPGVHAAVFDDDGGGGHPGLHRAIRHTLQATLRRLEGPKGRRAMAMAILVYQGWWKVEFFRSGFGFGRINLASSLSFQRTVVSNINPPTPRTDLKHP